MILLRNISYNIFIIAVLLAIVPFFLLVSVLNFVMNGTPVLFRQTRVGKDRKKFVMYKFRTMVRGAENLQKQLIKLNEASGPVFKIYSDPRLTSLGKVLNHTGLDELPQIINVIKGDMALIGPRPLPVSESDKLENWHKARYKLKPGIISPWILDGYHSQSFTDWMKSDISYISKKSLLYDTVLVAKAVLLFTRLVRREISVIL